MTTPARPTVAVVFGGNSSEHGVSCLTAAGVLAAIDQERYDLVAVGITRSGRWVQLGLDEVVALTTVDGVLPEVPEDRPDAVLARTPDGARIASIDGDRLVDVHDIDLAFSLLHGPMGEDGTIQGLFEMYGIRYVGSGVTASAVAMDKIRMKQVMALSALPIGPWVGIRPADWAADPEACLESISALRFPVYVKPARGGSSVGITRVEDPAGLRDAIAEAQRWDPRVIVEEGVVQAREIECGVLQDPAGGRPQASVVAEIEMHNASGFYDFDAKYLPEEQVSLHVPADLDPAVAAEVREVAIRVFEAFDCEGLARVDCFLTHDNTVLVNELNTMPGFTRFSMFPQVWAAAGVAYPDLIDRLIELALCRPVGLR
ncbi:D-alanine--D-alanine ligase family protein [Raineyella fluvialis]|uniref:D-alanine--D-alanine ligase n=1 Tax=Raineyella fluvialis TaxID=2662261 RepID=A0A5Q2FDC7_9ACTN|nr:D-alanine--D-alanine ligase family protein [Raineyella fluvialis]QGF24819.1 D-alanine--D-alanine ligase [Raineyella fluvialis]